VLSLNVLERISYVVWDGELLTFDLLSVFFVFHYKLKYSALLHEMADVMCTQVQFTLLFTVQNCADRNLENDLPLESLHFKSECTTVHTDITLILFKFKSIVNDIYFFFTFTENKLIKRKLFLLKIFSLFKLY
jgi:hypothetical protein